MKAVYDLISRAGAEPEHGARAGARSGTGKELVARALHQHSARADSRVHHPSIRANLPPELARIESVRPCQGRLHRRRVSEEGPHSSWPTRARFFFDEIGNIPLDTQAKLAARHPGAASSCGWAAIEMIKVDVRIIAATNVSLREMVRIGRFR